MPFKDCAAAQHCGGALSFGGGTSASYVAAMRHGDHDSI
jgi:hypothetical protein